MEKSFLPINERVNAAVEQYTNAIIKYIITIDPDIEYEVEYDEITNEEDTEKAALIDIQTEHGFLTIFPDFSDQSCKAALLNKGLIGAMELEGFDDDTIDNSPVYSDLLPFSIENVEMFAIILTNDMGLQHQKNIM